MTLKELHVIAKERGIKNVKKYKKHELETMLNSSTNESTESLIPKSELPDVITLLAELEAIDEENIKSHLRQMTKGEARKLRKSLYRKGLRRLSTLRAA